MPIRPKDERRTRDGGVEVKREPARGASKRGVPNVLIRTRSTTAWAEAEDFGRAHETLFGGAHLRSEEPDVASRAGRCWRSDFTEHRVHDPAPAGVNRFRAAVVQDIVGIAPRILKGVREDRHTVEGAVVVNALRERNNGRGAPRGGKCDGAEGISENAKHARFDNSTVPFGVSLSGYGIRIRSHQIKMQPNYVTYAIRCQDEIRDCPIPIKSPSPNSIIPQLFQCPPSVGDFFAQVGDVFRISIFWLRFKKLSVSRSKEAQLSRRRGVVLLNVTKHLARIEV